VKADMLKKFPFWLIGAFLYGISWPMPWSVNLAFLAWFAFVFLFLSIKKANTFWRFWGTTWIFSFVTYTICSGWFLDIPTNKLLIVAGAFSESLGFPTAFIPLYFLKKRIGFDKAIFALPFLFVISEWLYSSLGHFLGYLMVVHSQTANPWLLQYVDLFGYLSVTFWVMWFNVLIYVALRKSQNRLCSASFVARTAIIVLAMVSLPLLYAWQRDRQLAHEKADSISISMIRTMFAPNPNEEQLLKNLDRTVELTDSLDYYAKKKKKQSDLYVWHEGAIPSGNTKGILDFVRSAVNDWQVPLLSGMDYYEKYQGTNLWQSVNRVVLFQIPLDTTAALPFYDKVNLAPGWEGIPYLSLFHKLGIRFANENAFKRKGERLRLFTVPVHNRQVRIGTPICFEQNAPSIWNQMVLLGADCFVQVSFESWFGQTYFQKQVGYITRLRAIETRHSIARCSNGGLTFFVDAFGRIYSPAPGPESVITDSVALSKTVTFYTRHQNLFPLICLVISVAYFILAFRADTSAAKAMS
jgi:apolipoprotein N-acyltransferase